MDELKILNVYDRLYLRKAKFMQKVSQGKCPTYISELFQERVLNGNTLTLTGHQQSIHLSHQDPGVTTYVIAWML